VIITLLHFKNSSVRILKIAEIDLLSWSVRAVSKRKCLQVQHNRSTENAYTKPTAYTTRRPQLSSCPLVK